MYIKTVDRVEETEFSRYARQYYGITATPEWKIVKSYAFGGNISRNHLYHGSLDAAQHLARSFGEVNFSVNAMKKVIITFLGLLDTDGGDLRACEYAASVLEIAFKAKKAGIRSVSEDELPNP